MRTFLLKPSVTRVKRQAMKKNSHQEIYSFLEEKYHFYNQKAFIEHDPICIPHLFSKKEDIEIAGFFAATLAWGNRKSIIKNATSLMQQMDHQPHDFVLNHSKADLKSFQSFVHRTFNGEDCQFFIKGLQHLYQSHGGLEGAFTLQRGADLRSIIVSFRNKFTEVKHLHRSEKHLSNPDKKSSSKRLCMYLRWMVRTDKKGVDFGIWKGISPAQLHLPLDVHTGNVSRQLGLLKRTQNDWQAVEEITAALRQFDEKDPVKYDFALFGLGVEGFFK
jgi:uncharacterized protein (TIGR02757 family)